MDSTTMNAHKDLVESLKLCRFAEFESHPAMAFLKKIAMFVSPLPFSLFSLFDFMISGGKLIK